MRTKEFQVKEAAKYAAQRNVENVVDEDVAKDLVGQKHAVLVE